MRVVLEVVKGPDPGRLIEVGLDEVVRIGRTSKANVVMGDNFMSGTHFSVECSSKGCHLRDLKSRNGTKLNGELIIEAPLKNGDRVFAGSTDFIVRIEEGPKPTIVPEQLPATASRPPAAVAERQTSSQRKSSAPLKVDSQSSSRKTQKPSSSRDLKNSREAVQASPVEPVDESRTSRVAHHSQRAVQVVEALLPALNSYEAATPNGRLFSILSSQPHTVMALIDPAHDATVLELLRATAEQYQSLYRPEQKAAVAPYLVRLPPRSDLLREMIRRGWGREWGVYLTCSLSLSELREYFRTSLMVTMNDGMELFSRFYDPRFFREFLTSCSADEAERFFGPIFSYFMEDERPEILLQFTKGNQGVEKKGHLLSDLS